jgi:hypothetical protein
LLASSPALAVTPLDTVRYAPDATVVLGGTTVTPQDVAEDNLAGGVTLVDVGMFPNGTDIVAYGRLANGDQLLAFDIETILPGPLSVRRGDIVRFDGTTYSIAFDADANGIPSSAIVDAFAFLGLSNFLLSFDTSVAFPSFTADDEDVVQFANGVPSLFFDGSSAGIDSGLDLDAVDPIDANGHLLLSFDGSGNVDGIDFDDEDVLEFTPGAGTWELAYDGSAEHAAWPPADLAALAATTTVAPGGGGPIPPEVQGSGPGPGGIGGRDGLPPGTTRVFGIGTPYPIAGDTCIAIYATGDNGVADNPPGSVDDELLGVGGTDANGNLVDAAGNPGIALSRPLRGEESVFAYDVCADLVGRAVLIRLAAVPLLSSGALALAALALLVLGISRRRLVR